MRFHDHAPFFRDNSAVFSSRLPASLAANTISRALEAARARGPLLDLTESNPTVVGLTYPSDAILAALSDARALTYEPTPRGLLIARSAIADYYARRHGHNVDVERLTLTASTSEAYAWLFKLLCDPGDEVLVPRPSYPLFELLAGLESVRPVPYTLGYHHGWFLDLDDIARALTPRTRAILVVNPNNPAGWFIKREEHARLDALAAARGLAIVSDEVFADYAFAPDATRLTTLLGDGAALSFSMSGLSKLVGLPQLKLGWIHVAGPPALRAEANERLEHIADTYLSVTAPVQHAAPPLLRLTEDVGQQILNRVVENRQHLIHGLAGSAAQLLEAEGGWSAIVRLPATRSDEEWVLALLERGVHVHPGFFFDLCGTPPVAVVLSLICPPEVLLEALHVMRILVDSA
jgi:aspartate/methionine/tyrosine aminotransferase